MNPFEKKSFYNSYPQYTGISKSNKSNQANNL